MTTILSRNFYVRLQSVYVTLKSAEKKAADYMIAEPLSVHQNSVVITAEAAGCSVATLTRIARKLGYSGYSELRAAIIATDERAGAYGDMSQNDDEIETAKKVFQASIQTLLDTLGLIDEDAYREAVRLLSQANRYLFLGVGDAFTAAYTAYLKFLRAGLNAFCPQDFDLQIIEAALMREGDVVMVISHSGDTMTINEAVSCAKTRGAKIITITGFPLSQIAKQSDVVLKAAAIISGDDGEVITKRIPALCLVESLYLNVQHKLGNSRITLLEQTSNALKINKIK